MSVVEINVRQKTRPSLDEPYEHDGKMYKVVWSEPVNYVRADGTRTWRLGLRRKEEEKQMDPNETLRKLRRLLSTRQNLDDLGDPDTDLELIKVGDDIAELVESLDNWLSRGGFPPDAWGRAVHKDTLVQAAIDAFKLRGCGDGAHLAHADGQPFPKRCARCARTIGADGLEVR